MADEVRVSFGADIADLLVGVEQVKSSIAGIQPSLAAIGDGFAATGKAVEAALPLGRLGEFANGMAGLAERTTQDQSGATASLQKWHQAWIEQLLDHQSFFNQDNAAELAYWQEKLAYVKSNQQALLDAGKNYDALLYGAERQVYELEKKQAQEGLQAYLAGIKAKQEAARGDFDTVIALEREKLAVMKQDYGEMSRQYQGALREMEAMERQHLQQSDREWEATFRQIGGTFERTVTGMIMGTTTWRRSYLQIMQSIIGVFVNFCTEMLAKWLALEIAKTLGTESGVEARVLAEQAGGASGLATAASAALKAIGIDAAQAFGGVFAFLAPLLGPAAAGPAAAASEAVYAAAAGVSASAINTFDEGAWNIPGTMLGILHQGESVVPADFASGLRSTGMLPGAGAASSAGGAGALSLTLNIQAVDAQSVQRLFQDNSGSLMNAIKGAVRMGNTAGLRFAGG